MIRGAAISAFVTFSGLMGDSPSAQEIHQTKQKDFEYDYCSVGHSREVYEDTANFFNEVFGGYSVPMDPYMCPFHANNLAFIRDSQ